MTTVGVTSWSELKLPRRRWWVSKGRARGWLASPRWPYPATDPRRTSSRRIHRACTSLQCPPESSVLTSRSSPGRSWWDYGELSVGHEEFWHGTLASTRKRVVHADDEGDAEKSNEDDVVDPVERWGRHFVSRDLLCSCKSITSLLLWSYFTRHQYRQAQNNSN